MYGKLFNQFVISFRESIEASLVVMAVMVALKKRGDKRIRRAALWGIYTAIVTCAVGGYALGTIALVNNHGVELTLYIAAAVAVTAMVIWMMKAGKKIRANIDERISSTTSNAGLLPVLGIFFFVFFMITREGFEMVLLLLAFGSGVGGQFYVSAMLAGIGLAILLAYAISKGLIKVNIGKFLQQSAFVLMIFVVQLVFDCLHEAYEGNFLPEPSSQSFANFVDFVHDQVPVFSYIALGLFALIVIYHLAMNIVSRRTPTKPAQA
ncbi:MAG TPA: FTR1 family protein [Candidatus Kapabacteria bacterium]|nr:FTR1 family protein [Candidatus Kapabacteria bacterium]